MVWNWLRKLFSRDDDLADAAREEPRVRHYEFAHCLLRELAFTRPDDFVAMFSSGQVDNIVGTLVSILDNTIGREHRDFEPEEISHDVIDLDGMPCVIVGMPPPQFRPEAYFVGIVRMLDRVRFFTLERMLEPSINEETQAMLGEWTKDANHLIIGGCPGSTKASFIEAIKGVLDIE